MRGKDRRKGAGADQGRVSTASPLWHLAPYLPLPLHLASCAARVTSWSVRGKGKGWRKESRAFLNGFEVRIEMEERERGKVQKRELACLELTTGRE